jgi:hypothetical protein
MADRARHRLISTSRLAAQQQHILMVPSTTSPGQANQITRRCRTSTEPPSQGGGISRHHRHAHDLLVLQKNSTGNEPRVRMQIWCRPKTSLTDRADRQSSQATSTKKPDIRLSFPEFVAVLTLLTAAMPICPDQLPDGQSKPQSFSGRRSRYCLDCYYAKLPLSPILVRSRMKRARDTQPGHRNAIMKRRDTTIQP